ncbi:MAG TPA: tRNA pseudouridine(55) synthase TruB, partial [Woeseiaceae bacterium]|nr:tRNA pseudouridine(55) synthase TruB [Woeseiaceae bacterium]
EPLRAKLLPADIALGQMPEVSVSPEDAARFCGGQAVPGISEGQQGLARVYAAESRFLGVGELTGDGQVAPRRVFQIQEESP